MRALPIAAAATTLVLLAAGAPAAAQPVKPGAGQPCSPDAALLGFSDQLDKTVFEGTAVSGLSAVAFNRPGERAFALVDNIGTTPARMYELALAPGHAAVKDLITLSRPDGTPFTGADFDGEGLIVDASARYAWASSESEPAIRRFRLRDGRQVGELPVPDRFRVAPAGQATRNQTFEALAQSPNGRDIYAGMEGPLAGDGAGRLRIVHYRDQALAGQYAYEADAGLGLVELVALGGTQLLALERGFTPGAGNTVRVYRVSLTGIPDVSGVESLAGVTDPRTFAGKELLFDLGACPSSGATAKQPQPNPLLDNVEGMALGRELPGGRRELHLISDDNGSATQITRTYTLSVRLRDEARLLSRAILSATAYQPGPVSGTQLPATPVNGVTAPFPGQPIPGFSAAIPLPDGRLLAMPDNGFGAKGNSADFLLRAYDITPRYHQHEVKINGFVSFRDPDHKVPFALTRPDRLLTGADFDIESLARDADGNLWLGEEFGPYLVKTDPAGKVLQAPIPLPDGAKSPQSPDLQPGETPTVRGSRGFEALAVSTDGRTLYPILEGPKTDDPDQRRRIVYEFDVRANKYTGKTWSLRVDSADLVVGDAAVLDGRRLVFIERDNAMGPASRVKRLVVTDLDQADANGYLPRRNAVDLMRIADPREISGPARPGEYGVGSLFSFPLQSVETVLPLGGDKVLVANDNNFPGNDGRIPGRPDDTELIVIEVPGLRD
ncbi:esterase-like activity of phytase family protein [Longispora albida]|uniref:esterase-like activity of phytase family protein n=1 Tax=Longispora albida TaxID=203523 RepID=UPI000382732D|nr:esterase-like activity of phytase family protein [Longispora albida]